MVSTEWARTRLRGNRYSIYDITQHAMQCVMRYEDNKWTNAKWSNCDMFVCFMASNDETDVYMLEMKITSIRIRDTCCCAGQRRRDYLCARFVWVLD
mmetsp:Transcript_12874/g.20466  ORF Transcript_12874/g.20466 Transcript_12874/m.20466 type:complete len:97 (-) Transcript_12874:116-406(-)